MTHELPNFFYLVTGVLFIVALKMLTSPRTARLGNAIAAVGMLLGILGTLLGRREETYVWIIAGLAIGAPIGAVLALKVRMTAMPQMVSLFNGSGGLAAGLVTFVHYNQFHMTGSHAAVTSGLGAMIGLISFSGSVVAVGKLQEWIHGRPILFPFQKVVNLALMAATVALVVLMGVFPAAGNWMLVPLMVLAVALGVLLVIPIGGADMPVVIALLNSCTGLAAAATGFLLNNTGLIISGALVGSSGSILTHLMCKAMNRSLGNVVFGSFGHVVEQAGAQARQRTVRSFTAADAVMMFQNASSVVIVPGYGLAVAQAQHVTKEMGLLLEKAGVKVTYAIHPVAGRMPGHMNVLLAEADVPYSQLMDLDESNAELEHTDVALIVGANDVVNPAAREDPSSPIYGMPILNVDKAHSVIILKRSMAPGFSGIDNDLFYRDNTMMVFGDAKATLTEIVAALKAG